MARERFSSTVNVGLAGQTGRKASVWFPSGAFFFLHLLLWLWRALISSAARFACVPELIRSVCYLLCLYLNNASDAHTYRGAYTTVSACHSGLFHVSRRPIDFGPAPCVRHKLFLALHFQLVAPRTRRSATKITSDLSRRVSSIGKICRISGRSIRALRNTPSLPPCFPPPVDDHAVLPILHNGVQMATPLIGRRQMVELRRLCCHHISTKKCDSRREDHGRIIPVAQDRSTAARSDPLLPARFGTHGRRHRTLSLSYLT